MALMSRLGIQRLSSRIHSKSMISRSSATATATDTDTATATSKKVSDRIVKLFAVDPEGKKREVVGLSGQTLLKALTNVGLIEPASHRLEEIDACSAECEVSIAQEWLEKLPPRSYEEEYVLKRNSRARVLNRHSRLGCQVVLTPDLQGMCWCIWLERNDRSFKDRERTMDELKCSFLKLCSYGQGLLFVMG
ncbi:hypothetical protein I3842_13G058100 [Carya illinoinensis]|uniref:Ferredoxin n=1 Tax=Carya illinoinensis TaxID=32201 RepID=A0A922AFI8_CARIL|nr:hypothetical protein I3842_13G058100 [Carya illinoinensis]